MSQKYFFCFYTFGIIESNEWAKIWYKQKCSRLILAWLCRSSGLQVFHKIGILKSLAKFTWQHMWQSALFQPATLLKCSLWFMCFHMSFGKFLKVVSTAFLLVCFLSLKERTCETWNNVFYFTSKALSVFEKIKF